MDPSEGGNVLPRPAERLAAQIGLPAVAPLVERQGMAVDPAATWIPELEARRPPVVARLELRERSAHTIDVLDRHPEVEVVMLSGLLLEQRVDAPPALEAVPDAHRLQPVENLHCVGGAEGHAASVLGPQGDGLRTTS